MRKAAGDRDDDGHGHQGRVQGYGCVAAVVLVAAGRTVAVVLVPRRIVWSLSIWRRYRRPSKDTIGHSWGRVAFSFYFSFRKECRLEVEEVRLRTHPIPSIPIGVYVDHVFRACLPRPSPSIWSSPSSAFVPRANYWLKSRDPEFLPDICSLP